ncbi:unnamed protein product [Gordionus sp. m RMFG-2023]
MKTIKCLAAIATSKNEPLKIETIEVDPPKKGEVRIKIIATAVCHTDKYTLDGLDPEGVFPCILGHEGAGIVECIGEDVESVKPGDHVIPLYIPQCKSCEYCKNPKTNLCSVIRQTQGKGLMPDGTIRFISSSGQKLFHFMGTSTFSQYTVVPEISVAKVDIDAPLDKICLLSCGVSTGYGAVLNTAKVEPNSTCAIWGLGAVGLATIMGCKVAKCSRIIAIDTNPDKEKLAFHLGATEYINPKKIPNGISTKEHLINITNGGLDYTFECIGNVDIMREALESCHKGWGTSVIIGVAGSGAEIRTRPFQLVTGRVWKGCAFGGWKSRDNVPRLVTEFMNGKIELDPFITNHFSLKNINCAFDLMSEGKG